MDKKLSNFERYLNTYSGQKLLKDHSLDEQGTWEILGEDSNCDLGGSHYMPKLATVEGSLGEVVRLGVEMGGFWQWGGGGDFRKINIRTVSQMQSNAELIAKRKELEKQIADIDSKLR